MEPKESSTAHVDEAASSAASDQGEPIMSPPQEATRFMLIFSVFIALTGWICNFDLGYAGIVLIMKPYNDAFGVCKMIPNPATGDLIRKCQVTALQQSLISVTSLFVALGGASAGATGRYFGRRGTIVSGAAITAIGAGGMLGTSGNFTNYMVCKCLNGIGIGQLVAVGPIYGVECTVASKRGLLMSLYNVGLALGNVAAAAVCAGSASYKTNLAWQIPIICQIPLTLILGLGVYFFPESPRWLLVAGREESAREAFGRFYNKDPQSEEVTRQVLDVQHHIEMEKEFGATSSWLEIFYKNNWRRTFTSALVMVGLAISGVKFVVPYCALFLKGVGISNPYLINVIVAFCVFAGSFPGPFLVEYGGRRFSMLVGYSGMGICMLIFAAVAEGLGQKNPIAQNVLVAFLCIWAFIFGAFIGTSAWIASAEIHSVRFRTYGQACTIAFYQIFAFAAAFYSPYMLSADYGNMGTRLGFFYFGVSALLVLLTYLFVPETARLTLEQIDDHFSSGRKAWRTSTGRNKMIAKGEEVDHTGEKETKILF